jgi:hypothetical protein
MPMENLKTISFNDLLDLLASYTEEYTKAFRDRKGNDEMDYLRSIINSLLEEIDARRKNEMESL